MVRALLRQSNEKKEGEVIGIVREKKEVFSGPVNKVKGLQDRFNGNS